MMFKRRFFLFIVSLILVSLLAQSINAIEFGVIRDPKPKVTAKFGEIVTLNDAYIKADSDPTKRHEVTRSTVDNVSFEFNSIDSLDNGQYTFHLQAQDSVGNIGNYQLHFEINFITLIFNLLSPPGRPDDSVIRGFVPLQPYTLRLQTDKPGECRWSYSDWPFEAMTPFTGTGNSILHLISDYVITSQRTMFVRCLVVPPLNAIGFQKLILKYDEGRPDISVTNPQPIRVIDFPLQTVLIVTSTNNKPMICKYSIDQEKGYNDMPYTFDNYNTSYSSFTLTQQATITALSNPRNYNFTIQCEGLNGFLSNIVTVPIEVNTNFGLTIGIPLVSPSEYTSSRDIFVNLSTNKKASCTMTFRGNTQILTIPEDPQTSHTYRVGALPDGAYPISFECISGNEPPKTSTPWRFIVDTTAPDMIYVKHDPENGTWFTDKLTGIFYGNDSTSPVREYIYRIEDTLGISIQNDTVLKAGSKETRVTVDDLNLTDQSTYFFVVKVNNSAGMVSSEMKSEGIIVDTSLRPSADPCKNLILEEGESDIDCGGPACDRCSNNKQCYSDNDCISSKCEKTTSGAEKGLCAEDLCSNGALNKDNKETDIDCGGTICLKCDSNKNCTADIDCKSSYCDRNMSICTEASCTDKVQNNGETDADCGGSTCPKCKLNQNCNKNSDCDTTYCKASKCAIPSCTDKEINQDETDADCGGLKCPKCGLNKKCKITSDCLNLTCSGGYCSSGAVMEQPSGFNLFPVLLIVLAVLAALGGGGYYYYTNFMVPKSKTSGSKTSGKPGSMPSIPTVALQPKPTVSEEEAHKRFLEAQSKRISGRISQRKGVFENFESIGKKVKSAELEKKTETSEFKFVKPTITVKKPTAAEIYKKIEKGIETREEISKPSAEIKAIKAEKSEFDRLTSISKKKDEFERLSSLTERKKETLKKAPEKAKEDDFEKLSKLRSRKTDAKSGAKASKEDDDIFKRMPKSSGISLRSKNDFAGSLSKLAKGEKEESAIERLGKMRKK